MYCTLSMLFCIETKTKKILTNTTKFSKKKQKKWRLLPPICGISPDSVTPPKQLTTIITQKKGENLCRNRSFFGEPVPEMTGSPKLWSRYEFYPPPPKKKKKKNHFHLSLPHRLARKKTFTLYPSHSRSSALVRKKKKEVWRLARTNEGALFQISILKKANHPFLLFRFSAFPKCPRQRCVCVWVLLFRFFYSFFYFSPNFFFTLTDTLRHIRPMSSFQMYYYFLHSFSNPSTPSNAC